MAAKKVMSIAMDAGEQEKLKAIAEKRGVSVSLLVRDTCVKYLFNEQDAVKLIMSIPKEVVSNNEELEKWLSQKFQALMKHFKS